jgi:hypothetical protein
VEQRGAWPADSGMGQLAELDHGHQACQHLGNDTSQPVPELEVIGERRIFSGGGARQRDQRVLPVSVSWPNEHQVRHRAISFEAVQASPGVLKVDVERFAALSAASPGARGSDRGAWRSPMGFGRGVSLAGSSGLPRGRTGTWPGRGARVG